MGVGNGPLNYNEQRAYSMKLTALKSGPFAHTDPGKPHVRLVEGELVPEAEKDERLARVLIETEWAEVYVEPEGVSTEIDPKKMTKKELEDYADDIGLKDLDPKKMTKREMITAIAGYID